MSSAFRSWSAVRPSGPGLSGRRRSARTGARARRALPAAGLVAALAALGVAPLEAQRAATPPAGLDAEVARAMKTFQVPGLALAIVKDDRVVLTKGYGVRTLGEAAPVDAHTLFQIASNTKAFTTAALSMLVDERKLHWTDHVTDFLPWFQLSDPWVTREFTVEDLLTHRSGLGLGAGDLLWLNSTYGREEIIRRMRAIPPETSFRSAYAYDNVLYVAAGQIIPAVTDTIWDAFVKARIFEPLAMTDANTSVTAFRPGMDVATPYTLRDGKLVVVARDTVDNIAPAGAINASVADLSRWLLVQLDSGRIAGTSRRLWSAERTREMWTGRTPEPIGTTIPQLEPYQPQFQEYALGWNVRDYRGRKIALHSGGLAGMISRTVLVPSEKLGVVVLTSSESSASTAVAFWVLDRYLRAPKTDWIAAFAAARDSSIARAAAVERRQAAARDSTAGPSLPLARYAGRYEDAMYGQATIRLEDGRLVLRFSHSPAFVADLEHWQYDTFVARWRRPSIPDAFVTFALRPDGSIRDVTMKAVSPLADFSYDYQDLRFVPEEARGN